MSKHQRLEKIMEVEETMDKPDDDKII